MAFKKIVRIALLLFVVASCSLLIAREYGGDSSSGDQSPSVSAKTPNGSSSAIIADGPDRAVLFYFHGDRRCPTCRSIESGLEETLKTSFAQSLAAGELEWRAVNIDEPSNRHFVRDFRLVSSSAVIAEVKGGRIKRWKNLDLVWELVRNRPVFMDYVKRETEKYLGEGGRR